MQEDGMRGRKQGLRERRKRVMIIMAGRSGENQHSYLEVIHSS